MRGRFPPLACSISPLLSSHFVHSFSLFFSFVLRLPFSLGQLCPCAQSCSCCCPKGKSRRATRTFFWHFGRCSPSTFSHKKPSRSEPCAHLSYAFDFKRSCGQCDSWEDPFLQHRSSVAAVPKIMTGTRQKPMVYGWVTCLQIEIVAARDSHRQIVKAFGESIRLAFVGADRRVALGKPWEGDRIC